MSLRIVFCSLLLVVAACRCKDEVAVKAPPAPAPAAATEAAWGNQYWIIVASNEEPNQNPPALEALRAHPELHAQIARLSSTHFKNLKPCLEVIIAGARADKTEAVAYSKQLKALGIDNYVKNAGAYVGAQPKVDAYCSERKNPPQPASPSCGDLSFVEMWSAKLFLQMRDGGTATESGKATALDHRAWIAPVAEKAIGEVKIGDAFRVFDAGSSEPVVSCKVARFVMLTRGTPHFSYGRNEEGEVVEPTAPGCGSPELFAELACELPEGFPEDAQLYAIGSKAKAPMVFELSSLGAALEAEAVALAKKSDGYREAAEKARADAKAEESELEETHTFRVYKNGKRSVALVELELFTGEGNTMCGAEDVRVDLRGVFEISGEHLGSAIIPVHTVEQSEVHGVLDADGDGHLELFESSFPDHRELVGEDGSSACSIEIDFCDCPC